MSPLPDLIYPDAHIVDALFWRAFYLTSVTFALVLVILVYFLIQYRARSGHSAFYTHGNSSKALGLTLGLSIAVFVGIDLHLAWYDHHAYNELFDSPPTNPLEIRVMARQFEWNFRYAGNNGYFESKENDPKNDDIATIKKLVVPVNTPVMLHMQSDDVIHSLFIPTTRKKQDVVPGLETAMYFLAAKTTAEARKEKADPTFDYEIACAELCGLGHTDMYATLIVLSAEDYAQWQQAETKKLEDTERPPIWKKWNDPQATAAAAAAETTTSGENH